MFLEDLKKYHSNVYNSLNNNRVFDDDTILEHMLNRGIIDGMFRSDISVKLAGVFMRQTVKFCSLQHNDGENQFTKEDISNTIFLPYLRGICTEEGLTILNNFKADALY